MDQVQDVLSRMNAPPLHAVLISGNAAHAAHALTLRQLEYFVASGRRGEAGFIARSRRKVNVSSPSISAAITQLEQEFGLQLFVRNTRTACR